MVVILAIKPQNAIVNQVGRGSIAKHPFHVTIHLWKSVGLGVTCQLHLVGQMGRLKFVILVHIVTVITNSSVRPVNYVLWTVVNTVNRIKTVIGAGAMRVGLEQRVVVVAKLGP